MGSWEHALLLLIQQIVLFLKKILIIKEDEKEFLFTWSTQQQSLTVYSQGYVHVPAFYHNIVQTDLDYVDIPQKITLKQYMKDNMQMSQNEQEEAGRLDVLVLHCAPGGGR